MTVGGGICSVGVSVCLSPNKHNKETLKWIGKFLAFFSNIFSELASLIPKGSSILYIAVAGNLKK